MSNITLDSTSFSEQLGVYDFMNVLLAGATFISGLCLISSNIYAALWIDMTFFKGLGIVLLIYISGMIIQELGSYLDRKVFKTYNRMSREILKGDTEKEDKEILSNPLVHNPLLLKEYRKYADKLLKDFESFKNKDGNAKSSYYENDMVNGYIFSICQYYISVKGKDKKVEKMRALFAMSKTLAACFLLLTAMSLISILFKGDASIGVFDSLNIFTCQCPNKMFFAIIFGIIAFIFVKRMKRVMKNFLLILLGMCHAIILEEKLTATKNTTTAIDTNENEKP